MSNTWNITLLHLEYTPLSLADEMKLRLKDTFIYSLNFDSYE